MSRSGNLPVYERMIVIYNLYFDPFQLFLSRVSLTMIVDQLHSVTFHHVMHVDDITDFLVIKSVMRPVAVTKHGYV
jgi:hypothetical protein